MQAASNYSLSVAIITYNETHNLGRLLEALKHLGSSVEVVVVDSGSTDGTRELAASFGAKVYEQAWLGFAAQKNFAQAQCRGEYILSLDADEVPDARMLEALKQIMAEGGAAGYVLPRHAVYMGRVMQHAFCDRKLRLFKRSVGAIWRGEFVHEALEISNKDIKILPGKLLHYSYQNFEDHLTRSITYGRLNAQKKYAAGERFSILKLLLNPCFSFFKTYFLKAGFLDGLPGFVVSKMRALDVFEKYLFLYEYSTKKDK